jgi:8-amino-7-oxononanoate synthase
MPLAWLDDELAALSADDLLRRRTTHAGPQGPVVRIDGRDVINFGSNDYLGLAADPRLADAARRTLHNEGCGSGASPLVVGHGQATLRLERRLAEFEGTEAALVFSSGFAANLGVIGALVGSGDAVFSDRLNHASIIDGCRLSRATVFVYPHADCAALEALLRDAAGFRRRLIVTDSVFSMDGDLAPLAELAEIAEQYAAMLMVDEAHATGVFGELGRGVGEQLGLDARIDVRMGTLSKALGCGGGFVCGRRSLVDWLVNRARSYIFSTALPPSVAAAAAAALEIVRDEPHRRQRLLQRAGWLAEELRRRGWSVGRTQSQIVPLVVGEPRRALEVSADLLKRGLWVPAIRPPSVPQGESRLRIGLSYAHDDSMIERLLSAVGEA